MPEHENDDLYTEAARVLSHVVGLEPVQTLTLDDVRAYLIAHITTLLDRNPHLLMSILYRVDVAERDVQDVFGRSAPEEIPPRLADLMIERQLRKLKTRRQYGRDS